MASLSIRGGACIRNRVITEGETPQPSGTPTPTPTPSSSPTSTSTPAPDCEECGYPYPTLTTGEYGCIEDGQPLGKIVDCWYKEVPCKNGDFNLTCPFPWPTPTPTVTSTGDNVCDDCINDTADKGVADGSGAYKCADGSQPVSTSLPCKGTNYSLDCGWCFVTPTPTVTSTGDNVCDDCINDTADKGVADGNGGYKCADGSQPVSTSLPCKGTNYSLDCGWCFPTQTPTVTVTGATPIPTPVPPIPTPVPPSPTQTPSSTGGNVCDDCINDTADKAVSNGNGGYQCANGSQPVSISLPCKGTNYSLNCGWCFPTQTPTVTVTLTPVVTPAATPDASCSACGFQSTENCPDGQTAVLGYVYCTSAGKSVYCYQCPPSPTTTPTTSGNNNTVIPDPPDTGTYVLTSINGVLQWTATENC